MRRTLMTTLSLLLLASPVRAQSVPRVGHGWGVDTLTAAWAEAAWHDDARAALRVWREYLLADPRQQRPTPHWSAAEQRVWPAYDLTASAAYQGLPATVLDIRPAEGDTAAFVIRTLFAGAHGDARDVRPIALTRVYATREDGRWVLSNALPRHTRPWSRATVDRFTFVVEGRDVDTTRAARAVAFADSLAAAFGVPRLDSLTVYVARSPESLHRAMGIDWTFGGLGHGYALAANRLVLSGDARAGEENRHELVHAVLGPILDERRTHGLVSEGVATFYGGTVGRSYDELRTEYAAYHRAHAGITLDDILAGEGVDRGWSPAGALLVDMVHARGGVPALLQLLRSGRSTDELKACLVELLGVADWAAVEEHWQSRARRP
jgi:hypothetical protein